MHAAGPNKQRYLEASLQRVDPPFTDAEFAGRLARIRAAMAAAEIDCLFLSSPESLYYVSGYACEWYQANSPEAWWPVSGIAVHVDADDFIHFEHTQEATLIQVTSISRDVRLTEEEGRAQQEFVVDELTASGWLAGTVGLELGSYRPPRLASEAFQGRLESRGARVVDGTSIVKALRRVKSPEELAHVHRAQEIADIGMAAAQDAIAVGATELDVYGAMVHALARAGGEIAGIPFPVVSGPRAATVHGLAGRREIQPGELVGVDLCGVYHRYHANLARTFALGEPDPEVRAAIDATYGAPAVFDAELKPGRPVEDVLIALEDYYRDAGILGDEWWVGGYELGIAFPPDWVGDFLYSMGEDTAGAVFTPGDVVNFEANFYLPHLAGIALSIDTAVIDHDSAGLISTTPSTLTVIDC